MPRPGAVGGIQSDEVGVVLGEPLVDLHRLGHGHRAHAVHESAATAKTSRCALEKLTLQPNDIYSISTRSGQGRGTATGPGSGHLALPYADSFGGYPIGGEARYLAQQQGDFQSRPCTGRAGNCMRQMADRTPVFWGANGPPRASLGDLGWSDYTVTVRALLEQSGVVYLAGRIGSDSRRTNGFNGYSIRISDNDGWWLNEDNYQRLDFVYRNVECPVIAHYRGEQRLLEIPEVESFTTTIGQAGSRQGGSDRNGNIAVQLKERSQRERTRTGHIT